MVRTELVIYGIAITIAIVVVVYVVILMYDGLEVPPTSTESVVSEKEISTVRIVGDTVYLPLPKRMTNVSVEEAILWRRSIRDYTSDPLTVDQLSMILWSAYGVTETTWGLRASPSAGGTYPLEIYVVVGDRSVASGLGTYLEAGIYRYDIYRHALKLVRRGNFRDELARAALDQRWVRDAPINIVITAVFERTTRVYGERGRERYVPMEVGHVGQNIYLMATALRLGTVVIGAFHDSWVARILSAPDNETPMYIVPVGVPKEFKEVPFEEIHRFIEGRRVSYG